MVENNNIMVGNNEKKIERLYNGMILNNVFQLNFSKDKPEIDFFTGEAVFKIETTTVYIEQYDETKVIHQSIWKLLDFLTIEFTKQNHHKCKKEKMNREVVVSLSDYISLRNDSLSKPNENKIKKETKDDLDILVHMSIEGTENQKKNTKFLAKAKICESVKRKKDTIIFVFSEELAEYLVNSYVMQYPLSLLKTDSRNANLYPLGRKMSLHYGMDNNFIKGTNSKLGVDTALQYCPLIPSCEKVEKSDRQFNRRIYEPFEKTLRDLGFNYEFLLNGVVKNADDIHGMSCTQYLKMSVSFSIPDIIIDVERLTRRKEEKAKAKQRKEKNNV